MQLARCRRFNCRALLPSAAAVILLLPSTKNLQTLLHYLISASGAGIKPVVLTGDAENTSTSPSASLFGLPATLHVCRSCSRARAASLWCSQETSTARTARSTSTTPRATCAQQASRRRSETRLGSRCWGMPGWWTASGSSTQAWLGTPTTGEQRLGVRGCFTVLFGQNKDSSSSMCTDAGDWWTASGSSTRAWRGTPTTGAAGVGGTGCFTVRFGQKRTAAAAAACALALVTSGQVPAAAPGRGGVHLPQVWQQYQYAHTIASVTSSIIDSWLRCIAAASAAAAAATASTRGPATGAGGWITSW